MQTRSSSASSMTTTGTVKRQYTSDELEILMQKNNEKERQLKEQAESLRNRQDHLDKLQEELEQKDFAESSNQPAMDQILESMKALVNQIEMTNTRIAKLEIAQKRDKTEGIRPSFEEQFNLPQTMRSSRSPEQVSPIRLKDAIDTIPKFDGHKMSVFHFSKICERALELIPQYHEYFLVQLIINKLQGHAYSAIEGTEFTTVLELTKRLKLIFGANKSVDQYRGELANIYMKPNENIFDYISRVQELRTAILDGETDISGYIDDLTRESIEITALNSFINGLPSDLLVRVKLENPRSFKDCIGIAVQLSKTIETENARKRIMSRPSFQPRADAPYNPAGFSRQNPNNNNNNDNKYNSNNGPRPFPSQFSTSRQPTTRQSIPQNYEAKICRYCKTPGHLIEECRKLAYRKAMENQQLNNIPGNQQGVPLRNDVRRNEPQVGRQQPYLLPKPVNIVMSQEEPSTDLTSVKQATNTENSLQ